jgi:hypothetical protein
MPLQLQPPTQAQSLDGQHLRNRRMEVQMHTPRLPSLQPWQQQQQQRHPHNMVLFCMILCVMQGIPHLSTGLCPIPRNHFYASNRSLRIP